MFGQRGACGQERISSSFVATSTPVEEEQMLRRKRWQTRDPKHFPGLETKYVEYSVVIHYEGQCVGKFTIAIPVHEESS